MDNGKTAYICGPLTDLLVCEQKTIKGFYARIADACKRATGLRAFVPHEHCDPIKSAHLTPEQVDRIEREQVCKKTSILIAVVVAPSWGSGIEVEMARQSNVPVIVVAPEEKKVSRLLLGNKSVVKVIYYKDMVQAIGLIENAVCKFTASSV